MPGSSPDVITCRFSEGQWVASFQPTPQVGFGSDLPIKAIRRLLDATEAEPGIYQLICDQDMAGSGVIHRSFLWGPPDLLFPCSDCRGTGEYVGLIDRAVCQTCQGKKFVQA